MKAIIFAGGTGTRLWPLSRRNSPKQFEKIIGNRSTLQLAVERLYPDFAPTDIYVSTNIAYKNIVKDQLPNIPEKNFIFEPEKRDVGPAVAFAMGKLLKDGVDEPVVILWSDHLVKHEKKFKILLKKAAGFLKQNNKRIIFIGHKPRFASENLGWIHYGHSIHSEDAVSFFTFDGFKYKPDKKTAEEFYNSGHHAWNLGYFVTTPSYIYEAFHKYAPRVYNAVEDILKTYGTKQFEQTLLKKYGSIDSVSFDNAVIEKLDKSEAATVVEDIGWSDVGAWEALKEALENNPDENITRGRVYLEYSRDSLVYNYEGKKLIVGVDLEGLLVVNTGDVLLVARKSSVPKIKEIVENFVGTENEKLT